MAARPPLELAVELTDATGKRTRWDGNARSAGNVPSGISFNTKRGDGFSDGPSIVLQRRIDRDYADINLYDDVRLIGADGSIAYEGYIASNPRSFDGNHQVSITVAGPMTLAQQRTFSEIYIDRDLSGWTSPSNKRQIALLSSAWTPNDPSLQADPATGNSAVMTGWTSGSWTVANRPISEALYQAPSGVSLGKLYYQFGDPTSSIDTSNANWFWATFLATDDTMASTDSSGTLRPATSGSGTVTATTTTRTAAAVQLSFGAASIAFTDTIPFGINWRNLAPMGTHGLTLQSSTTPGPGGLFVSDMIADICRRFTSLDPSGIQATSYPVDHAVFSQSAPYDAWLELNTFHLWELAVWENRTLFYYPQDTADFDWFVRLSDPGVTVDLPGESVEQLANGIVVSYLDVQTGRTEVLSPDTTTELQDPNPLNPATLHGQTVWTSLDLSSLPLTAADAIQLGIARLAEYNQVKAAGTITFTGHIQDRAGHWQPGWKVRATDTIAIVDHPDDRPRLIGETSWDHDNLKGTIAVDNTLDRVDAIVDRFTTALKAANVSG